MDDIPLPDDIPFPEESVPLNPQLPEDVCDIRLPDDVNCASKNEVNLEEIEPPPILVEENLNEENKCSFSERHEMMNSRADVPVPGESEHEFYTLENTRSFASNSPTNVPNETINTEIPMPSEEVFPLPPPTESEPKTDQTLVSEAPAMASTNTQAYATANYMQYPSHMTDPSMMSHNYSYSYSHDYVSMYHNRMSRPSYHPNAYAYQNYNHYPYAVPPQMQQMYDGRTMNPYGNYSQQMLPSTPSYPTGHSAVNTYNPPLPSDYPAQVYPSSEVVSNVRNTVEKEQELSDECNKSNDNVLPETNLSLLVNEKTPGDENYVNEDVSTFENQEDFSNSAEVESIKDEFKQDYGEDSTSAFDNFIHSEDTNRYSPSLPMEEDDQNHQLENVDQSRPQMKMSSVLGKVQAKKRLMAFQISKQAAAAQIAAKKQAQTSTGSNSSNKSRRECEEYGTLKVGTTENGTLLLDNNDIANSDDKQSKKKFSRKGKVEKARETMEQIEEIKRNEMLTRDTLLYRQTLFDSHEASSENNDKKDADDRRKSSRRRSHSRSRSRRRSRTRSRDRKYKRSDKKYRRRSRSKSRSRSRSHSRSSSRHKIKASDVRSWNDFKVYGFQLDRYRRIKFKENRNFLESEIERRKRDETKHRRRHRSRSRDRRSISIEKEVIEGGRKKKINMFEAPMEIKQPVVFTKDKNAAEDLIEYPSHIVLYTNTRPIIKYCENLKFAKRHFINREQLLESLPDDIALIVKTFWAGIRSRRLKRECGDSRFATSAALKEYLETGEMKGQHDEQLVNWWSKSPLKETGTIEEDIYITDDVAAQDSNEEKQIEQQSVIENTETTTPNRSNESERTKLSVVAEKSVTKSISAGPRKSRFDESNDEKTEVSVVVRSRWDSDYEDSPRKLNVPSKNVDIGSSEIANPYQKLSSVTNDTSSFGLVQNELPLNDKQLKENNEEINIETLTNENNYMEQNYTNKIKEKSKHKKNDKKEDKSKIRFTSPEEWQEESDYESHSNVEQLNTYYNTEKSTGEKFDKAAELNISGSSGGGDRKLVSEYEEFLKMVSFDQPEENNRLQMYEGPKPPPRFNDKINDTLSVCKFESSMLNIEKNNSFEDGSDEEKAKLDIAEEEFDIDKFFLKEKEKKLKKMALLNAATAEENNENIDDSVSNKNLESELKHSKKKDKSKRKLSLKLKKRDSKNKKKKADKKKKYGSSSGSPSDSIEKSDDSSSSTSPSSNSSSSDSSSVSSDESSDSESKKKHRKTKKLSKKQKKRERKSSDKRKKKKKRKLRNDSDTDDKKYKKKKSKSVDGKKKKSKKLPPENFLELIEKSLAVSLKKTEDDETLVVKKAVKEKRKKRKKKSDKEKKEKQKDLITLLSPESTAKHLKTSLLEEGELSDDKSSPVDKSPIESKKKKKKSKRRKDSNDSSDEMMPKWKKKKIDPKEIEENMAKFQLSNPFFEENLDDWDKNVAGSSANVDSMRDASQKDVAVTPESSALKKKKKKKKVRKQIRKEKNARKKKKKLKKERKKRKNKTRNKIDDTDVSLTDAARNSSCVEKADKEVEAVRNFAMFSNELQKNDDVSSIIDNTEKDKNDDDGEYEYSPKTDNRSLTSPFKNYYRSENSQDSKLNNNTQSTSAERYSPTECDMETEEIPLPADNKISYEQNTRSETSKDSTKFPSNSTNATSVASSSVFPCFSPTDTLSSSICFPSAVHLIPVPAPIPVPPPSVTKSNFSLNETTGISTPKKIADSIPVASVNISSAVTLPSSDVLKNFGKTVTSNASDKSFVGKMEIRTKAAKKFVHSNIFDSFDVEEYANLEAPCKTEIPVVVQVDQALPEPVVAQTTKDMFETRVCIELPENVLAENDVASTLIESKNSDDNTKMQSTENEDKLEMNDESVIKDKTVEKLNESYDSAKKKDDYRDDEHRNRRTGSRSRSRSRSHSHSRSRSHGRHRKRHHKDRYRKRSRDHRSRSKSRSRKLKERESRDPRLRYRRESTSRDKRYSRRSRSRSVSAERIKRERFSPNHDHGNVTAFKTALANIKTEKDDSDVRRDVVRSEERYTSDLENRLPFTGDDDYSHYKDVHELTTDSENLDKNVCESKSCDSAVAESKQIDINMLQENLSQLKESLKNLNKQGVQLNDLQNVLSVLENTKINKDSLNNRTISASSSSCQSIISGELNTKLSTNDVDYTKIITLCQAIQNSLPASQPLGAIPVSIEEKRPKSPPPPSSSYDSNKTSVHMKTKKSVADSTNTGYSKSSFKKRSREISPKKISLDERLEQELGVKRSVPPASVTLSIQSNPRTVVPPNTYYQTPMFADGMPDFSTPPPPVQGYHQLMTPTATPEMMGYYTSNIRAPLDWSSPDTFVGQNQNISTTGMSRHMMLPTNQMSPHPRILKPPEPVVSKQSYRLTDGADNKVHSIQVGNVLQIVPTELPSAATKSSVSSQNKVTQQVPVSVTNVAVSSSPLVINSPVIRTALQNTTAGYSSILSGHLPVSFAAAPAVSGSRSSASCKEQKQIIPNELKSKSPKDSNVALATPTTIPVATIIPPTVLPSSASFSGSKIINLPLPPGTPETEVKKLLKLAKETRKLKVKAITDTPTTPNSDDSNNYMEESTEGNEEPFASISIKQAPEQGILVSPGFKDKPIPVTPLGRSIIGSTRKVVSFVDGIKPGSASVVDVPNTKTRKPSPPPDVLKKKHKVRVKIIRPDDSDDDDLPPPPPPGPPPPELYPSALGPMSVLPPGYALPKM